MAADVLLQVLADEPAQLDHAREVAGLATRVSLALGLDRHLREDIARAAELHDIGKLGIPDEILSKPGPLAAPEVDVVRRHTVMGEALIAAAPTLRAVALLVRGRARVLPGARHVSCRRLVPVA